METIEELCKEWKTVRQEILVLEEGEPYKSARIGLPFPSDELKALHIRLESVAVQINAIECGDMFLQGYVAGLSVEAIRGDG